MMQEGIFSHIYNHLKSYEELEQLKNLQNNTTFLPPNCYHILLSLGGSFLDVNTLVQKYTKNLSYENDPLFVKYLKWQQNQVKEEYKKAQYYWDLLEYKDTNYPPEFQICFTKSAKELGGFIAKEYDHMPNVRSKKLFLMLIWKYNGLYIRSHQPKRKQKDTDCDLYSEAANSVMLFIQYISENYVIGFVPRRAQKIKIKQITQMWKEWMTQDGSYANILDNFLGYNFKSQISMFKQFIFSYLHSKDITNKNVKFFGLISKQ